MGRHNRRKTLSIDQQNREDAIAMLSGNRKRCACCGSKFDLEVDHIKGGGEEHRREEFRKSGKYLSGTEMYRWLKKNNYPSGFQVLCHLCNDSKGNGDMCKIHNRILAGPRRGEITQPGLFEVQMNLW